MFYNNFFKVCKKTKKKQMEEINGRNKNKLLTTHISKTAGAISFKFGMWGSLPGEYLCSETDPNRMRDHGATKV